MKLAVFSAAAALALAPVALAQTNNAEPQSANAQPQKNESVRQEIKTSLERAGFTNITIKPEAFYIRATDKSGNPVSIAVDPNSFEEVATIETGAQSAPGQSNSSNAQKNGMFATVPSSDKLSSNLIGLNVYNNQNQDIGKIKDVSMNQDGVQAYILAVGGFLGMGDRYVAVNPSALKITYNGSEKKWHAAMNATADQLKAAPEFKYTGPWNASSM